MLAKARTNRLRFNPAKFKFHLAEVPFVGHRLTEGGLQIESSKVAALVNMPGPTDVAAVRRFIRTANYISRFVPNLSAMMQPLQQLMARHVQWWWALSMSRLYGMSRRP